jgi:hypothetical protein
MALFRAVMERVMNEFFALTGRRYGIIDGYGLADAEYVIAGMGSFLETATATTKYLREQQGLKVGTLSITSFRPFPGPAIVVALKSVKAFTVIERIDNSLAQICMMHPNIYVAQTTAAHINHFYKAIMEANEYPGPAVVNVYTTSQPEHAVPDCNSSRQAKLAVESRAFLLYIYHPRKADKLRERLSLIGNPAQKQDWWTLPNGDKPFQFVDFARTEGRFAKQFGTDGAPSETLLHAQADRLRNWRLLQELTGLR